MQVSQLWRFPVKSLQGEQLERVAVTSDGLFGDRRFAIFDLDTGFGLTARRAPELLFASARLVGGGDEVEITLPDGSIAAGDAALSAWLGRRVELRSSAFDATRNYEVPLDFEKDEAWVEWSGPEGAFHDSTRTRVSLVSTATLRDWDPRRFRSNVVLDGEGEDALVGTTVTLGTAQLDVPKPVDRCVMVTRPQPGGIDRDLDVMRTILTERAGNLAVGALVVAEGEVALGDELSG